MAQKKLIPAGEYEKAKHKKDARKSGAGTAYMEKGLLAKNPFPVRRLSDGKLAVSREDVLSTNKSLNQSAQHPFFPNKTVRNQRWVAEIEAAAARGAYKQRTGDSIYE